MKSPKLKLKKTRKVVKPVFVRGEGRWMMVFCPAGHLLKQLPYGNWTEGQKALKSKRQLCARCAKDDA